MTKIICTVLCAVSLFGVARNVAILRSVAASGKPLTHSIIGVSICLALAIFWAYGLYGIRKKAPIVWKLGWAVIIGGYLIFVIDASATILRAEQQPIDRWMLLCFVVISSSAIAAYWCYFWTKQKSYFAPPPPSP